MTSCFGEFRKRPENQNIEETIENIRVSDSYIMEAITLGQSSLPMTPCARAIG